MHYKEIELNERNCPFEVISILNKVKDFVIDKGNLQDKPVLPIHAIDLRADGKIGNPYYNFMKNFSIVWINCCYCSFSCPY
jgi:hypothetical protein